MAGIAYADRDYKFIDADQHVTEPAHLFKRVPQNLQHLVPQPTKLPNGNEAWVYNEGKDTRPVFPTNSTGGVATHHVLPDMDVRYETMRPSHYDGAARLADMDLDGVHGAVIFSSIGLGGAYTFTEHPEAQKACVRAYNDWLIQDFCSADPNRLFGVAMAPATGVDDLIAECEDALRKGHKGVAMKRWPNGGQRPMPEDEKFWAYAEDNNLPVAIHFGPDFGPTVISGEPMGPGQVNLGTINKAGVSGIPVLDSLIGAGVPERFPRIKLGLIESNVGWIPCYLEQADDRWLHYRFYTEKAHIKMTPSQQWRRNFWASFMCDRFGVLAREFIGVDRIMWSTDFPHGGHEWPNTRNVFDRLYRGVPADDVQKIVHDNAATFFNIDV